ncbi:MAG: transcriptional regulator [Thermodesulfobacteriota bacterium]
MTDSPYSSRPLPARDLTAPQAVAAAIAGAELSAREISQRIGLSERQVYDALEHLARSARGRRERLRVTPAACMDCGFTFAKRERLTKPSRCPTCRSTHIEPPRFRLG